MITSLLTFALGETDYAVPLGRVREVVACRSVVRVPHARECVRGVMNLRGSVVPVIDLSRRLGIGDITIGGTTCVVLLDTEIDGETAPLAALVDEIRAVVDLEADAIAAPPDFGTPVDRRLVRGVASDHERFAYVLDLDEVLAAIA